MHAPSSPFSQVITPYLRRFLPIVVGWCVAMGFFLRALEVYGPAHAGWHLGLTNNILASLINGLCCQAFAMAWLIGLGRLWWQRSPAARQRYERDGFYALLPVYISLPFGIAGTLLGCAVSHPLLVGAMRLGSTIPLHEPRWGSIATLAIFSSLILVTIDYQLVRTAKERDRFEAAQRQAVEAQLQRLQAQMEPHMLFNTLANLHALIEAQPAKAQDMLAHLIDYLRATLRANRTHALSLRDEIARVNDYLALMKIRMGERLLVELNVPDSLGDIQVPPMLIQPLVENAIKHGLDPVPQGGHLRISARQRGALLEIRVQDDGLGLAGASAKPDAGFGLSCIHARLQTCYGDAARFMLEPASSQGGTVATLHLPIVMPDLSRRHTIGIA